MKSLFLTLLLTPALALAQGQPQGGPGMPDPLTKEFRDCIQKAQAAAAAKRADDPVALHACLSSEVRRQEGRINSNAQKLAKLLPAEDKKKLDEASSAWRRFRDANCSFYGDPKGAPPLNLTNADCMLNNTVNRAVELDRIVSFFAQRDAAQAASGSNAGVGLTPGPAPVAPGPAATPAPTPAPAAPATEKK